MMLRGRSERKKRERFQQEALPHLDHLYAAAKYLTRNPDYAADLVQETMLRGFRFFDQFKRGTNCRAWLSTILYNTFRNGYRRAGYVSLSSSPEEFERAVEAQSFAENREADNPESELMNRSMDQEVEAALNNLTREFRAVVSLVDIEELSYEEAAAVLKVPVGTIRSRLSRARAVMRRSLQKFAAARKIGDR